MYINIDPKVLGERLEYYMKLKNVTAKELRKLCFLADRTSVYKWKRGDVVPNINHICNMSALFGVPVEELLGIDYIAIIRNNEEYAKYLLNALSYVAIDSKVLRESYWMNMRRLLIPDVQDKEEETTDK